MKESELLSRCLYTFGKHGLQESTKLDLRSRKIQEKEQLLHIRKVNCISPNDG